MGDPMTEAAGSSPGPSAPGEEPWPRSRAAAHLRPPPRPRRPRKACASWWPDAPRWQCRECPLLPNLSTATASSHTTKRFLSASRKGKKQRDRAPQEMSAEHLYVPGTVLNACRTLSHLVTTMTFQRRHYHRFTGEETEAVS